MAHAIIVAIIIGVVAFTDRTGSDDIVLRAVITGMFLLFYFAIASRRVHDFIESHRRKIYALGLFLFGLSAMVFLFAASNIPPSSKFSDTAGELIAGFGMLGIAIVMLPRVTKGYRDHADDTGPFARARHYRDVPSVTGFSGKEAGMAAVKYVLSNALPFLRIAGPWALIIWALPFAIIQLVAYSNGKVVGLLDPIGTKMPADFVATIWWASFAIASWLFVPIIAVAWHRYVLENRFPLSPIALPDLRWRRYLALYGFGPLMLLLAASWFTRSISPHIVSAVGGGNAAPIESVGAWVFASAFVFLTTPYAIVLPSVAIDEWDSDPTAFLISKPRLLRSVGAGALFAVAPFAVAQQAFALATRARIFPISDLASAADSFAQVLLLVAALAAWATYLSRVYEAVKDLSVPQVAV